MLTQGCCHFSGKPSTTRLSGSEVSLKKMCYEILPPLRSVRMTLPRKLNDLWVNIYIITYFFIPDSLIDLLGVPLNKGVSRND